MCESKIKELMGKEECSMSSQEKKVGKLLEPRKEVKMNENKPRVKGKSNEQLLEEIKLKVWKVVEQMCEKPKLMEAGFYLTNYETFVKQAMELKEQLRAERIIPVSEECSAVLK